MFRDEAQQAHAIRVLLSSVPGMERYWTESGPTAAAVELCQARGGGLSGGEAALLLAAFDLWNGEGNVTLARLLEVGGDATETLWALLLSTSMGYEQIDAWIATTEPVVAARRRETPEQKLARFRARGSKRSGAN